MAKTRRPQGVDYKNEIYAVVLANPGITMDKVVMELKGARTSIYNNIHKLISDGILIHKNHGLYINPDHVPNISKKLENLQNYLKGYHQTVSNVLPRIEKNAKKSGKPIFYSESAADVIGIDGMTGKPFTGEIQRINEKCKDDLLLIMSVVNNVIRATLSLYIIQTRSEKEKQEIDKAQKKALKEIERTRRKLLEMTAQKNNSTGIATFHMWWYQLTAGFELKGDNLVWEKTPKNS